MKIVQIGSYPLDSQHIQGGVEASIYGLTDELAKSHKLFVIDIPRFEVEKDTLQQDGFLSIYRFHSNSTSNISSLFSIFKIAKIIRTVTPDICHIHTTSLFSFILYLILKLKRNPVIITVHGLAHIEKQNIWKKQRRLKNLLKYYSQSLIEFLFLSICRVVIVDTTYVAEAIKKYKEQGKIIRVPICTVIPQGINHVFYQLESTPKKNHLLTVGAINKRKGHLQLIEVMVIVKEQFPDFQLSIFGSTSDKNYFDNMHIRIIEKSLDQNIHIITNAPFEEILRAYSQAEIFVSHSEEESQGIVFCEAMAAGKPIVSTNVGGIPWVVKNNVNGLLSDYGDIDTFVNNIITLLKDEKLRKNMEEANKLQSHKYDWKIISNEIIDLYKLVIINH